MERKAPAELFFPKRVFDCVHHWTAKIILFHLLLESTDLLFHPNCCNFETGNRKLDGSD
jgi:hypothetical protein